MQTIICQSLYTQTLYTYIHITDIQTSKQQAMNQ